RNSPSGRAAPVEDRFSFRWIQPSPNSPHSGFHAAAAARLTLRRARRLLVLFDPQRPVPQKFGLPEPLRNPSRLHEQMIAQPVHVDDEVVADVFLALQPPAYALRTPAHRARLMQERVEHAAAGKREGFQRLELLLHLVHLFFKLLDLAGAHLVHLRIFAAGRRSEFAAHVEQFVLYPPQVFRIPLEAGAEPVAILREVGANDSDDRIQLIDRSVGLQPRALLGHALAADQRRIPLVTRARVNPGQAYRHYTPAFIRCAAYAASPKSVVTGSPASFHPVTTTLPDASRWPPKPPTTLVRSVNPASASISQARCERPPAMHPTTSFRSRGITFSATSTKSGFNCICPGPLATMTGILI